MESSSSFGTLEVQTAPPICKHGSRWRSLAFLACLAMLGLISINHVEAQEEEPLTLAQFIEHFDQHFQQISENALPNAIALSRAAEDSVRFVDYLLQYHEQGYNQFTENGGCGPDCESFRNELKDFLYGYQTMLNNIPPTLGAMAVINGLAPPPDVPPVDLSSLSKLIDTAPAFLLYPFYDAFSLITFNGATSSLSELNRLMVETDFALSSIIAIASSAGSSNARAVRQGTDVNTPACQLLVTDTSRGDSAQHGAAVTTALGGMLSTLSEVMYFKSLQQFNQFNKGMSLIGTLHESTNINLLEKLATGFNVSSHVLESIGTSMSTTINRCRLRLNNQLMFCMLQEKNIHHTNKVNTHSDCLERVAAGNEAFGF